MAFINFQMDFAGQVGVLPRLGKIFTNDTLAQVTAPNYLRPLIATGITFRPSDQIQLTYGALSNMTDIFDVNISGTTITLTLNDAIVTLPVVSGDFAVFNGTTGTIKDAGYSATNAAKTKVIMANSAFVVGNIATASDTSGTLTDSGVAVNKVLQAGFANPDVNENRVYRSVAVTAGSLAAAGSVVVFPGVVGKQYVIKEIMFSGSVGITFAGGGGDRNIQLTDGTNLWTVITATALASPANARWADASNIVPLTTSIGLDQFSVSGAPIVFKYQGGTADYLTGTVTISVEAIRVF